MNKEYNKGKIEIKAKELLLPIKASCPDNVWQEINYHLNEHTSAQRQWTGKLSTTSKIVAVSVVFVGVIGLLVWKFSDKIGGWSYNKAAGTTLFRSKKATAPVKVAVNTPQPKPTVATTDTATHVATPAIKKDTIKTGQIKAVANTMPPAQNVVLQQPAVNQRSLVFKHDSLLLVKRNAAIKARHIRDSVAMAARVIPKTDSVAKLSARPAMHDSVTMARSDTAGN